MCAYATFKCFILHDYNFSDQVRHGAIIDWPVSAHAIDVRLMRQPYLGQNTGARERDDVRGVFLKDG